MGTFSGSIHVRGSSFETVRGALVQVARKLKCRFFLAPEVDGWVTAFPSDSGQDVRVSQELATRLHSGKSSRGAQPIAMASRERSRGGHVLHVILHDSDVFYYHYYRDGLLRDRYSSRPDYFKKVSPGERRTLEGKAELLSDILPGPEEVHQLRALLASRHPDDAFFAHTLLESFGEILALPYCGLSYEDVESGDEEIEDSENLIHIPDLTPEVNRRKADQAAAENEFAHYRRHGLLLWEESRGPACVRADQSRHRLIALSNPTLPGGECQLSAYSAPWQTGPTLLGLPSQSRTSHFEISPSGRYLAVGHGFGDWSTRLWDLQSRQLLWAAADSTGVGIVGFTPDEKAVVAFGESLQVLSMENGRCLRTLPFRPYNGVVALHPDGTSLIALHGNHRLVVLNFQTGESVRSFTLEHLADFNPSQLIYRALVTQAAAGARKAMVTSIDRQTRKMGKPGAFEQWKEAFDLQSESVSTEAPYRILFSSDGRFLFCATDRAAWIFQWHELLAEDVPTPKPLYRFCPHADPSFAGVFSNMETTKMVLALAHDEPGELLLVGMGDGAIHQIDLRTGFSRLLLQVPDALPVSKLGFSKDGSAVYTILSPFLKDLRQATRPPDRFQIWAYAKLRDNAS